MQRMLVGFAQSAARGEAFEVARIVSLLGGNDPSPQRRSRILRHLLWLLKYGYVRRD